jgi:hypothetical protein
MGANVFMTVGLGNTAKKAFDKAVYDARYQHGHGGYTGTIAEKNSFVLIPLAEGLDAFQYAEQLLDGDDERICDKWGDAGCIHVKDDEYLFFGWASQ